MTFNILKEPWIPLSNGQTLSLLDALEQSHVVEGVSCASPLETVAVYRLIIAFVMDALTLRHRDARRALLKQGRFDRTVFEDYVSRCEREGASFDLFDAKRPFMQASYDPAYDNDSNKKPASIMALRIPSGNNHVFFDHQHEARFTPAEALREMLTALLFCTAGAQGYPSSVNNTPCVYALHHGGTLLETLTLNMVSVAECGNIAYGKPAWRETCQIISKKEFANVDMLAALTWQPRRVTLLPDKDGFVTQIYWQPGHNFKGNALWRDPHVPYRVLKSGEFSSLKPQEGRAFWRDVGALSVSRDDRYGKPPLVVQNALDDRPLWRLSLAGLVTNNAAIIEQQAEEMNLPANVLEDEDRGDTLRQDLLFIEDCAGALRAAAKDLEGGVLAPMLLNTFFNLAHEYMEGDYLERLSKCETDEAFVQLRDAVSDKALRLMLTALDKEKLRLGNDAKMLKAQAEMRKKALAIYYKKKKVRENE